MKLVEALRALQATPPNACPLPLQLVCGFTPLHLQTFLRAHIQARAPKRKAISSSGLFGDCLGNLERLVAIEPAPEAGVVALEWSDFDPRLGLRSLGGWRPRDMPDILETVSARAGQFTAAIERCAARVPLRISLPTLPLPPVSHFPGVQASRFQWKLRASLDEFAAEAAGHANVALVNPQRLDHISPPHLRLDVVTELASGFPYAIAHASALGQLLAQLVVPATPKKGLITDLDDTLWRGLVGEVGAEGIHWDLDHKSHSHGLYQQMLASLAEAGVLLAVASKNEPAVVARAFDEREDLAALKPRFFPLEVSWRPKSEAVGRILQAWNVGADSVVMIDDSPLELAEVQAAHPGITCLRFPTESDAQVYALLEELRDLFGKTALSDDDALRLESLRNAETFRAESADPSMGRSEILARIESEVSVNWQKAPPDPRALELLNKTNQFNLNGRRYSEGDWLAFLREPESWLMAVAYRDKFGPLGTIGVLAGSVEGRAVRVASWVLSCRAFSRQIEHASLKLLYNHFDAETATFEFEATPRNGPLQTFITELVGHLPGGSFVLRRPSFEAACPPLHHRIKELPNG